MDNNKNHNIIDRIGSKDNLSKVNMRFKDVHVSEINYEDPSEPQNTDDDFSDETQNYSYLKRQSSSSYSKNVKENIIISSEQFNKLIEAEIENQMNNNQINSETEDFTIDDVAEAYPNMGMENMVSKTKTFVTDVSKIENEEIVNAILKHITSELQK